MHQYGLLKLLVPPLSYFIDLDQEHRILKFLDAVDSEVSKTYPNAPDRSVLLSALCFPVLDLTVRHMMAHSGQMPHLGQVAEEANELITKLFSPFFLIPRRLKGLMISILTSQFRFTPLDGRDTKRKRLPRDESVPFALKLFQMRSSLEPELFPLYTLWTESWYQNNARSEELPHEEQRPQERTVRRRRRYHS
jgi:tRNA nucleotidyltransferase/poly(A) polymerase